MNLFITSWAQMLTKFLLFFIVCSATYAQFINKKWSKFQLIAPNKKEITISWAITNKEQRKGLSNLDKIKMKKSEGLFFAYKDDGVKTFWMPETFFNLDIIFLDKNLKVIGLETDVKHFKTRSPYLKIPRTQKYYSRHVLELHSGQANLYEIKKDSLLKWKRPLEVRTFLNSLKIK